MELKLPSSANTSQLIGLLIVPYGIETYYCSYLLIGHYAFNRTLWN